MTNDSQAPASWKLSICGQTDLGRQRTNNEDNFLVVDLDTDATSNAHDPRLHEIGDKGSLLIVADGMGGANAGEVASQMAVEIISRQLSTLATGDLATGDLATGDVAPEETAQLPEAFLTKLVEAVK